MPKGANGVRPDQLKGMIDQEAIRLREAGFEPTWYLFEEEDVNQAAAGFVAFLDKNGPFEAICIGAGELSLFLSLRKSAEKVSTRHEAPHSSEHHLRTLCPRCT